MSKLYDKIKTMQADKGGPAPGPGQDEELLLPGLGKKKKGAAPLPIPVSSTVSPIAREALAAAAPVVLPRRPVSYLLVGFVAGVIMTWTISYILGPLPGVVRKEAATAESRQAAAPAAPAPVAGNTALLKSAAGPGPGRPSNIALSSTPKHDAAATPEPAAQRLTTADLQGKTRQEIKIMRNEIYARHSYIFNSADMKNYFAAQPWYTPRHSDINAMLTETDKANIELIRSFEKKL